MPLARTCSAPSRALRVAHSTSPDRSDVSACRPWKRMISAGTTVRPRMSTACSAFCASTYCERCRCTLAAPISAVAYICGESRDAADCATTRYSCNASTARPSNRLNHASWATFSSHSALLPISSASWAARVRPLDSRPQCPTCISNLQWIVSSRSFASVSSVPSASCSAAAAYSRARASGSRSTVDEIAQLPYASASGSAAPARIARSSARSTQ
mmetsp:Transcript_2133/g.6982  ORF Transcript_2133/g.6982 Transcript_2133/m.6982 type:complete len:215 (+) Transcript_2133:623-1267(+)